MGRALDAGGRDISIHAPRAGCDEPRRGPIVHTAISIHAPRAGCDCAGRGAGRELPDFNPRTPCGVRPALVVSMSGRVRISIHAPRAGCDARDGCGNEHGRISIHAPRAGCDFFCAFLARRSWISIHAPRAGCDDAALDKYIDSLYISIHAPRAGCDAASTKITPMSWISIHAPRAGCDFQQNSVACFLVDFNPRTPCGVRRNFAYVAGEDSDFNPRTPCGVRRQVRPIWLSQLQFQSTHPVRGATRKTRQANRPERFQSTHPVRGATPSVMPDAFIHVISIHAPRAGCDHPRQRKRRRCDISIHAPRAGCDVGADQQRVVVGQFQSTHPVRGATVSDSIARLDPTDFNPRTPCGVRPDVAVKLTIPSAISIHAPRAGCDHLPPRIMPRLANFNPRTPCGVRPLRPMHD